MPHSVHSEVSSSKDDAIMEDAPAETPESATEPTPSSFEEGAAVVATPQSDNSEDGNRKLAEDLFAEDSSDDEFASSSAPHTSQDPLTYAPSANFSDTSVMRAFYQRLFPFRYLFQWLNHSPSPTTDFAHREFAFTLPSDAYLRYQSFPTADLLRKQCVQQLPSRFEIGPVYSTNPRDRKTLRSASAFRPLQKELVFDIDMTDYDSIRTCCTGASICTRCWSFITMAIRVVDAALREDFGFKHILWVYSGRRGAHAWVCDKRARELDDSKRRAVAGYIELLKGGDKGGKKVNVKRPLHPHLERSLNLLKPYFQSTILEDQDAFLSTTQEQTLVDLLPDKILNTALSKKWQSCPDRPSVAKWSDITSLASSGISNTLDTKALRDAMQDIVLEYTYPRLDAEVSKKLNHLLKSPFCVHPGTGRVCVPIDVAQVDEFDPQTVPTVTELLGEIDTWDKEKSGGEEEEGKKIPDWEKTRLKGYVEYFRGFVNELLKEEGAVKKRGREEGEGVEF